MKMILLLFALCSILSCDKTNSVNPNLPEPDPEQPVTIDWSFDQLPDSVLVNTEVDLSFKLKAETRQEYNLTIDTIIPSYVIDQWIDWSKVPEGVSQIPSEANLQIVRQGVTLQFDGKELKREMPIKTHTLYTFTFSNPQVVGDYIVVFRIKSKSGKEYRKELKLKVVSPPVDIIIYNVDPWLDLQIYDKNFFEELNEKYTFEPLSEAFVNKATDTVYTYECPKPGYPGEWTYPGLGLTVYLGQEGAQEFVYNTEEGQLNMFTNFDNDIKYSARTIPQKQGFHCLELTTYEKTGAGQFPLILKFADHWGKETKKTLTVIAVAGH